MATKSTSRMALADVFDAAFSPPPHQERQSMQCELMRLKAMPLKNAIQQLGWRIIKAFTLENTAELVFWTLVCTALLGGESCSEMLSEFAQIMSQSDKR